jgi:hypothetical protein
MPTHPFFLLEQLYMLDDARTALVEKGRQIAEHDQKLLTYIRQQCQAADEALQGKYSIKAILLMDRVGIKTMDDLWKYRQFMGAIYGYRGVFDPHWIPTNTVEEHRNEELLHELQPEADSRNRIEGVIIASQEPLPSPLELKAELGL